MTSSQESWSHWYAQKATYSWVVEFSSIIMHNYNYDVHIDNQIPDDIPNVAYDRPIAIPIERELNRIVRTLGDVRFELQSR